MSKLAACLSIVLGGLSACDMDIGERDLADHANGGGISFTTLQSGFTQDIFGVSVSFMGGVAFAPDGDPLVTECLFSGSALHRYDRQSAPPPLNGTSLHTETILPSNAGCGITSHPNGTLYTNTSLGVIQLDANTGAQIGGPFGPSGNALGIAVEPASGDLAYVGADGTIHRVDAALTTTSVFSAVTAGNFVDGIFFDPAGDFLFMANRLPTTQLTIVDAAGALVQNVPMTSEPDGISFHVEAPTFVIANNTDGTIARFDFPANDFTQVPVQSVFASGGFRGDLSQVGADGCAYLTQAATRYNDGTFAFENSLVRICGGFAPPPGSGDAPQRMTGGGTVGNTTVRHGFELHCTGTEEPNNLQVSWGRNNKFHLDSLDSTACSDDVDINEGQPVAGMDTFAGEGTGHYNGRPGHTISFVFTDAGEPGVDDTADITITAPDLTVVLSASGTVNNGNHQAHPE